MAIEKVYLDPNAAAYTDDEIVGKVNTATDKITRAGSVDPAARPIESGEIGNDEIEAAAGIAKSKLAALEIEDSDVKVAAAIAKSKLAALEIEDSDVKSAAAISLDKCADGTTNKAYTGTEQTKLASVEDDAKDDQTGAEVRDLVVALADDDRKIIVSRPISGQKKIYAVQTHTNGKQEVEQSDTPEA